MEVELLQHQVDFIEDIDTPFLGLVGGYRSGKALEVNQSIQYEDGPRRIGDACVGDQIYDHTGKLTTILGVFPQGKRETYELEFVDGQKVLADGDHLWSCWQTTRTKAGYPRTRTRHVDGKRTYPIIKDRLFTTLELFNAYNDGIRYAVPNNQAVNYNENVNIVTDRYIIGALLGDGCLSQKHALGLSTADEEVLGEFTSRYDVTPCKNSNIDYQIVRCPQLKQELNTLGLVGTKSHTKFIPQDIKYDSVDNRMALLQGLMDTDGTVDKSGRITFCTVSKQLADDVVWLSRSLGFRSNIAYIRKPFYTYNGVKQRGRDAYDVKIIADKPIFRLQRKLIRQKTIAYDGLVMKSITKVGMMDTLCIKVSNEEGLFLTNDFVVTHNTYCLCYKALYMATLNELDGALLEPTHGMLTRVLIPTMDMILYQLGLPFKLNKSDGFYDINFNGTIKRIWLLSAENYSRAAGMTLSWFGIDEMDTMKLPIAEASWKMMVSRLTRGDHMQGFSTSTPEGFNFLYKFFEEEKGDDRMLIRADTRDNPFISGEYVINLQNTHTEKQCEAYLSGHFVNMTDGNVYYQFDRATHSTSKTMADYPNHPILCGQDFNVNNCATSISIVDGGVIHTLDEITGARDTYDVIRQLKQRYPNRDIRIYPDASGNDGFKTAISDVAIFKQAGFIVRIKTKNPFIKDRVAAVNTKFKSSTGNVGILINTEKCKSLTKTLEQQGYEKGVPDKTSGLDHMGDAFGYFVWFEYPVVSKAKLIQSG